MFLAAISNDLKIYDCESWTHRFNHGTYDNPIKNIEWSEDGKYLIQVNPVGRIEVLSASEDGVRCLQCIPEELSTAATFHRGGHRQVAVGCSTGKMYIWDTKFKSIIKSFTNAPSSIKMLDFNCKNKYLAAGLESGETVITNVVSNIHIGTIKVPFSNKVSALRFHNELRSILALASDEGCILVRNLDNGKNKMFLKDAHKSVISDIEFSRVNKDVMLSCGYDKKMLVFDIRMQINVSTVQTDCALTCVDINNDSMVALGNKKGEILIYDLRSYDKPVHVFADHKTAINKLSFQPEVAKRKRFLALDASLKESCSSKMNTPQHYKDCRTPDSVKSYDFIEQFNSPCMEMLSPPKEKIETVNASKDSFLVNIVGGGDADAKSNLNFLAVKESPNFITRRAMNFSNGTYAKQQKMGDSNSLIEKLPGTTSASTPLLGRLPSSDTGSPSPIHKHVLANDFDMNDSEIITKNSPPEKKVDSVDSVSAVETVKCSVNTMTELGNELKDFITYSIYDVMEQSRNNFLQMTIQQTKNRLFLEDQIAGLANRVQDLQQKQNILIEENKKLSIEVEMLRSFKSARY